MIPVFLLPAEQVFELPEKASSERGSSENCQLALSLTRALTGGKWVSSRVEQTFENVCKRLD